MVAVVGRTGTPLDPTSEYRARKLLKSGRAVVYRHEPFFAIRLLDRESADTIPEEYTSDVGYAHVGVSIKSEKNECISEERNLLEDEVERNRDRVKYRRGRRIKLRYRECKFDNRKKTLPEGWEKWFPPSLRHRVEAQVRLYKAACEVFPIKTSYFEMGKFDTQLLKALEAGEKPPAGTDYQHGGRYLSENLRYAVFSRDGYTCQCCGRNAFKDGAKLHAHHIGYWKKDRTNRMSNLLTVCEKCHTTANHKEGGKLYGLDPKLKPFTGATFMTTVRFEMFRMVQEISAQYGIETHMCYGAGTKCTRKERNIEKSHANDAYCIGQVHPKHRTPTQVYQKVRRNDRKKEKFYDAVYIDTRTGKKVKAAELGSGRTKRNTHLKYEDLRIFRGRKLQNGHRTISWGNPPYENGCVVEICKTIKKKGRPDEVVTAVRKVKSVHGSLKNKKLLEAVQAGKPHRIKPGDINWNLDFGTPLPDGKMSTNSKNVVRLIKRPVHKGWELVTGK